MQLTQNDIENINYVNYRNYMRTAVIRNSVLSTPVIYCILAYFSVCLLSVGVALIVIFSMSDDQFDSFAYMASGIFSIFFGISTGSFSIFACYTVKSVSYVMVPCCLSKLEKERLQNQTHEMYHMLHLPLQVKFDNDYQPIIL
ncbi:Hypothetical_protein [Hexamita inflata]|uniref:Hypothetical_protein n=1 Tax=Hexamita inflata TaxID=28002 RepID=A0AA86TT63_9EUKA|nr:Hypothetical protein HINF_LOCUS15060 [Hexamita inflata]CAI9977446.1 Hypothetical protein HINF_LOCUS65091 [Hexamita inflata]